MRVVYSPLDAVKLAREHPDRQVVFFGIGFETTAPANAMAVHLARAAGARELLDAGVARARAAGDGGDPGRAENRVQAFLAAGHVCSVMGYRQYPPIAEVFGVPIVVTGFEPLDILEGIRRAVRQLEAGEALRENAYERVVTFEGNPAAQALLAEVFEETDRAWRGIGTIPRSGWRLSSGYRDFDAEERFEVSGIRTRESPLCHSGEVLRGLIKPNECPAFGKECTPRTPLGATMVSSEGACAAYYNYGRFVGLDDPRGPRLHVQPAPV